MATLEHEQPIPRGPSRPRDHHVFVSAGGRRQSALRAAGFVAGALALVWLVALGLALAGSTRIPGLPVPDGKSVAARDASAGSAANAARRARAHVTPVRTATPPLHEPRRAAAAATTAGAPASARSITPATRTAPVVAPTPVIPTAATPTQGWSRRGWTAPPGQTRRSEPTPRGTGHPADATASTTHGNGHGKG